MPAQLLLKQGGQHHNREKTEPFECTVRSRSSARGCLARRNGAVHVSQRSPPCRCFKWRKTSPHAQTASISKNDGMHADQDCQARDSGVRFALFGKKWDVTTAVRNWYAKSSGFALFAIKSHRVCSFSKNGTQGAKKQKDTMLHVLWRGWVLSLRNVRSCGCLRMISGTRPHGHRIAPAYASSRHPF
jgi:hypothetical protein